MLTTLTNYVLMFFIYSALGWTIESIYCSLGNKKIINRGFLYGPMCPIYGAGALVFEILVSPFGVPFEKRWWIVILLGMVLADILEYLTSFIMEKLFNARWWDYSENFLNLHGRICFKHTCYWGVFSLLYVYLIKPMYEFVLAFVPQNIKNILVIVILCVFIVDLILTVKAVADIQKLMRKIDSFKESLTEYRDLIRFAAESIKDSAGNTIFDTKEELTNQFADIMKSLEELGKKNTTMYSKTTQRLYSSFSNLKKITEAKVKDIENIAAEIKSKFNL